MHPTGASPRAIKKALFWSDGWMLLLHFVVFCVSVSEQLHHGTLFSYFLLTFNVLFANHRAVSKPRPTEHAETYAGCGIPRCYKVFCAVCTRLCAGRCARCLCCLLFLCCLDVSFSNRHVPDLFLRQKKQHVRAHQSYVARTRRE